MRLPRAAFLAAVLAGPLAIPAAAQSIRVGDPGPATEEFGPGDMMCDMNKCRLFNLPPNPARYPERALIEFGFPGMSGQDRFVMRRCTNVLCKASVSGNRTVPTSRAESASPTIFLVPVEIKVQ